MPPNNKESSQPTPEEVANIEKKRTLSDATLLENGAEYRVDDELKTIKIAESTNKQILGIVVNRRKSSWHELTRTEIQEMTGHEVIAEIPEDSNVPKAVSLKVPILEIYPNSPASLEINRLAHYLTGRHYKEKSPFRLALFDSLVNWLAR